MDLGSVLWQERPGNSRDKRWDGRGGARKIICEAHVSTPPQAQKNNTHRQQSTYATITGGRILLLPY